MPGPSLEAKAADRLTTNPFGGDVCQKPLEVEEAESIAGLNGDVLGRLAEALEGAETGMLVLLTAPKAGYGKTHLLGQLAGTLRQAAIMVPVSFQTGDPVSFATVCRRAMEALHQTAGERPGWTRLREVSAEVVAALMHRLISTGQLTCANQEQALRVLAGPALEIFDEKGSARLIGDWLRQNREQLCRPLTALAAGQISAQGTLSPAWIEALLEHAIGGGAASLAVMDELTVADAVAGRPTWLKLVAQARPVLLLVDHLDGFYRNSQAGVTLAALLVDLADAHQMRVVLSVNQDLWQETFGLHLPSALEDRLTASQVSLRGLTASDAEALVRLRLERAGVGAAETQEFDQFLAIERFFLGRPFGSVPARVFLRHAARQWEMFQNSVPPPPDEPSAPWKESALAERADHSLIPLMTETGAGEEPAEFPAIFDADTGAYVKEMAAGLAEPLAEPAAESSAADWSQAPLSGGSGAEAGVVTPSADAFVKLREMLGRLRQPSIATETATEVAEPPNSAGEAELKATAVAVEEAPATTPAPRSDVLLGRFEALRLQMSAEADSQPLDFTKLAELIRLAGRRFPLVRFGEHELPGLTGRHAMGWTLQNVEILFGLANFSDTSYWKTISGFAAGRQVELNDAGQGNAAPVVKVKLVTFKTDREQAAYQAMTSSGALAESVLENLDAIHLDAGSVASLYAMQRIIKEAETGALQVEPAQVMSALARELDFFWRRVTRLG
ncbi:MAG: hypothetical protein U0984_06910 [Prosthecobacter sp.]|nr:hypothetical protein [Prosthecobacter sp.]